MRTKATLVVVLLTLTLTARAEPISQLHPTGYVNDFAHVLSPSTIAQLDEICRQVDEKAHAQIAVVTIQSLDGSDIESYAVELFKKWGIGSKSTDHGVLILLAVKDHRYRTEVGYGLEPILPDGKVGGFGREAVPLLRQNDYDGAISLLVTRVADVIAQDAGVQLTGARPQIPLHRREKDSGIPPIVFIIILLIVLFVPPLRRLLFWMLIFGGGGGGRSCGGWGGGFGGGGGGGFGGFGGGSSGGGGASGSW